MNLVSVLTALCHRLQHINAVPEIREFNRPAYDRYRRYGHHYDSENFRMDFTNDVLIYKTTTDNGSR